MGSFIAKLFFQPYKQTLSNHFIHRNKNMIGRTSLLLLVASYCTDEVTSFAVAPKRMTPSLKMISIETSKAGQSLDKGKNLNPKISGQDSDTLKLVRSDFESLPSDEGEIEGEEQIGIWAARLLLLVIAIIWGTNFASVKYLETLCFHPPCVHPPSEAALARFGIASVISLPLLAGQRKDIILAGIECGAWISMGYITQALALATIPAGKCAFICSLTVVVVPLISSIFFDKPIKPLNLVAAAVALSGVAILEGLVDTSSLAHALPFANSGGVTAEVIITASVPVAKSAVVASSTAGVTNMSLIQKMASGVGVGKGDIIALGQPFGFGLAFMRIEHYVEKFQEEKNQILTLSAAQCVTVGILSLLWVLHDFHGVIPNMEYMLEAHRLAAIAWTGIVTTVLAIYFEGVALQTATATDAALTFSSEPVWASLFGVWLLHEHLNLNAYIGGSIILTACVIGALSDLSTSTGDDDETESPIPPVLGP